MVWFKHEKPPEPSMKKLIFALCAAALPAAFAAEGGAGDLPEPFGYPSTLLDAPATLAEPPGGYVQTGRLRSMLGEARLAPIAERHQAAHLREGAGDFARDYACLTGTEGGRPVILWLIATGSEELTEAQLEWTETVPRSCGRLQARELPVRLGRIGLGMTKAEVAEHLGTASWDDGFGWRFWFSQRFLKNARGLQELELNWLGVQFEAGRVKRAFASLVRNP